MPRIFAFTPQVKREARIRQYGICAHCGESLDDVWEAAHHVVPNQSGAADDPEDAFLRTADNCVVLCDDCHDAAHAHGAFLLGAVAPADWYPYSHGKEPLGPHEVWRQRIAREWRRLEARKASVP